MRFWNSAPLPALALWLSLACIGDADAAALGHSGAHPVRTVYQYPKGTWVENIAVRANGNLLVTLLTVPELHLLDPLRPAAPKVVHSFPSAVSLLGIAEASPDVFAVVTGNYSITAGSTPGSCSVWKVDMRGVDFDTLGAQGGKPTVSLVTDMPEAGFLNGMANLPQVDGLVLIADIHDGVVYRLDVHTGTHEVLIRDPLAAVTFDPRSRFGAFGINGLHVRDSELYFTNTGQGLFARMPIQPNGSPTGGAVVVARTLNSTEYFDDFALDCEGNAYLAAGGNAIERVTRRGRQSIIAGQLNSTLIAGPTAAQLGRGEVDRKVLYVVTSGALATPVSGTEVVGGQVLAVGL